MAVTIVIDNIEELIQVDKRIDLSEEQEAEKRREGNRDRWEFGRMMLAEIKPGKKNLPDGYLDTLAKATGKSRTELKCRKRFALQYEADDDDLDKALSKSWTQIIKSLPKEKDEDEPPPKPKPTSPPTPNKRREEIVDLSKQGKTQREIAEETGISPHTVRKELERDAIEEATREDALAESIDYKTAPMSAQAKVDGMVKRRVRDLEAQYRTALLAAQDQYRAKCDADLAAYKARLDATAKRERVQRDEERSLYKLTLEVQRARGLITPDEYDLIRSCLHPDSRLSVTDEKLGRAFRIFNESRVRILLVKEV